MANIKLNYKTVPLDQFVSHTKAAGMKYTLTNYTCPLCRGLIKKRDFEKHVYQEHAQRADECFAKLFGVPWPARCTCGRELHYSQTYKGFPTTCGNCAAGNITNAEYHSPDEANKAAAQLKAMFLHAQSEAKRLAKEAELERIPLNELPFPTRKDPRFIQRISKEIRVHAINGEKEKLIQLANFIDAQLAKL